jgi:hypothetical protein
MPCRLLVLLGAGASYDCCNDSSIIREGWRPPLARELFASRGAFRPILNEYPLAQQAAVEIRRAIASPTGVALETFLREHLRESPHAHHRRQYWAIPLYLQHLLVAVGGWDATTGFTEYPESYDRLVNAALQVDDVTFVTLNYDELLDRRLFAHHPLRDMGAYLGEGQNWALIKLHGSVNWGRQLESLVAWEKGRDYFRGEPFGDVAQWMSVGEVATAEPIELRPALPSIDRPSVEAVLHQMRLASNRGYGYVYYPALSAPLGAEDELVCPPEHVQYLKAVTDDPEPLHLLVIGYSGLDQAALELLSSGGRPVASLTVVDVTEDAAHLAMERIGKKVTSGKRAVVGGGFSEFARGGELDRYIDRIRACAAAEDREQQERVAERQAVKESWEGTSGAVGA